MKNRTLVGSCSEADTGFQLSRMKWFAAHRAALTEVPPTLPISPVAAHSHPAALPPLSVPGFVAAPLTDPN